MTRIQRDAEVKRLANGLGLTAEAHGNNLWWISGSEGHRGGLYYNQRSGVWKALGGKLSQAHFGTLGGMLNLFACSGTHTPIPDHAEDPLEVELRQARLLGERGLREEA